MNEHRDLAAALQEADWAVLLPRLAAYADRKLFWRGWGFRSSRPDAMEIVNDAIEACLAGEREWRLDSRCDDLEIFLRGIIKSLVHSAKKSAARRRVALTDSTEIPDTQLNEVVSDDGGGESAVEAAVVACVEDDEDLMAYYLAVSEGLKREDIADALGWEPERVSKARNKLQRRLISFDPERFSALKKKRLP